MTHIKTIKEWQAINEVVNRGLRDLFTGIDDQVLSKAEVRKEIADYNQKKKLCGELLKKLYEEIVNEK